jgi:hypothetical protein
LLDLEIEDFVDLVFLMTIDCDRGSRRLGAAGYHVGVVQS